MAYQNNDWYQEQLRYHRVAMYELMDRIHETMAEREDFEAAGNYRGAHAVTIQICSMTDRLGWHNVQLLQVLRYDPVV
jgi:hypothetical protein